MICIDVSPAAPTLAPPRMDLPTVPKHVLVTPAVNTQDAQLEALVQQQRLDHAHFQEILAVLKSLCERAASRRPLFSL